MNDADASQDRRRLAANGPFEDEALTPGQRSEPRQSRRVYHRRSLFWPVVLIGVGVLLLLADLGLVSTAGWALLWRFWPIALIALGLDVLIGHRSLGGAIVGGILVLLLVGLAIGFAVFVERIPILVDLAKPATLQQETVRYPVEGLESAEVTIDWTSAPGQLRSLSDSAHLIEAELAYRGELVFDVSTDNGHADVVLDSYLQGGRYPLFGSDDRDAEWDVRLSPRVTLDLNLDASSGSCTVDLSDLQVRSLRLDGSSGSIELILPAGQSSTVEIDGGPGSIDLILDGDTGVRLALERGSGSFEPGKLILVSGEEDDEGVWKTPNYATADHTIELTIDQGSGSLQIR